MGLNMFDAHGDTRNWDLVDAARVALDDVELDQLRRLRREALPDRAARPTRAATRGRLRVDDVERAPGESAELPEGGSRRPFGLLERYEKTPTAPLFKAIVDRILGQLSSPGAVREGEPSETSGV